MIEIELSLLALFMASTVAGAALAGLMLRSRKASQAGPGHHETVLHEQGAAIPGPDELVVRDRLWSLLGIQPAPADGRSQ